jgi:MFS family permease
VPVLLVAIAAMLVQQTAATVAKTAIPVMFPAVALSLGVAPELVLAYTWLYACVGILVMAGCGAFILRYGAIRVSQWGCLLMALGMAVTAAAGGGLWRGLAALALGAVLVSIGSTSSTPASSQILARYSPPRLAPLVFSVKQSGVPAGIAIAGGLVVPLAETAGWQAAALAVAVLCALIALGLEPCRKAFDADRRPAQKLSFGDLRATVYMALHDPALRVMSLAAFAFVGLQSIFTNYTVVYLYEEVGYSAIEAGAILSIGTLVAVPARILWGVVASTLVPARPLLGVLAVVMSLGAAAMGAFTPDWSRFWVIAVCVVVSATALSWHGVLLSEVARLAPSGEAGRVTGGVLVFGTVGQIVYPLLFAAAYAPFGYHAAYVAIALPAVGLAWAFFGSLPRQPARLPADAD